MATVRFPVLLRKLFGFWKKSIIGPVILSVVLAGYLVVELHQLESAENWIDHSDQAIARVIHLQKLMLDAETGIRGYLLTNDRVVLQPYLDQRKVIDADMEDSKVFVHDNPVQQERIVRLHACFSGWLSRADGLETRDRSPQDLAYFGAGLGRATMDSCRAIVDGFVASEEYLRRSRNDDIKKKIPRVLFSAAAISLFLRVLGVWLLRKIL